MRLEQLDYLLAIQKYHSMNTAGEKVFVSQQAISIAIQQLEEEFGTKLVQRTNKGSFLTETGMELASATADFYQRCSAIKEQLSAPSHIKDLHLLIDYSQIVLWDNLYPFFYKNYPQVNLHRILIAYSDIETNVLKNNAYGLFYLDEYTLARLKRTLQCTVIRTMPVYAMVHPSSPLAQFKSISLNSIRNMKIPFQCSESENSSMKEILSAYHLEEKGNTFLYQMTGSTLFAMLKQPDVIAFATSAPESEVDVAESTSFVYIPIKERPLLHLCCLSAQESIPSELLHALDSLFL